MSGLGLSGIKLNNRTYRTGSIGRTEDFPRTGGKINPQIEDLTLVDNRVQQISDKWSRAREDISKGRRRRAHALEEYLIDLERRISEEASDGIANVTKYSF